MSNESSEQPGFIELWDAIVDYESDYLFQEIILPRLARARALMANLSSFRQVSGAPQDQEERSYGLWELYALSRVSDHLLLSFQSTSAISWDGPSITPQEYLQFFEQIGFESFNANSGELFSEYHHEIFKVEQSAGLNDPVTIQACTWPGLRFGDMLFSRAGVKVTGGPLIIAKDVAESSTLYFTHRRLNRSTNDLSMGWGHNSQWRTSIRRDYETQGRRLFNVDGKTKLCSGSKQLDNDRDGLTIDERIELCKNRCFIRTTKPHDDLWPFDDHYSEDIV